MKLFLMFCFSIFMTAQAQLNTKPCDVQIKTSARSLWSLNSGIAMQFLTADIKSSEAIGGGRVQHKVLVNTPRFPNVKQEVPYNVVTIQSAFDQSCYVRQVTAVGLFR